MRRPLFFFLLLLLLGGVAHAQDGYTETTETEETYLSPIDPADVSQKKGYIHKPIEAKHFDSKKWEEVVAGRDYREGTEATKKKERVANDEDISASEASSDKKRLQRSWFDLSDDSEGFSLNPTVALILQFVFYAIAFGIIGAILFLIFKNISFKGSTKVSKTEIPDETTSIEDIQELEIDRLLREALESGNYRLVIRIYFLELLQKLDQDGSIIWKRDKTNRDYLSELFVKAYYYDEVRTLTLAYEQVWYGDHRLSPQTYDRVISAFKELHERLKTSSAQ